MLSNFTLHCFCISEHVQEVLESSLADLQYKTYMIKTNPPLPLRTKFKNLDQSSRYLAATKFESNKQKI